LREDIHYWQAGIPAENELCATYVADGGTWGQPFTYQDLAHVIVPRSFSWEFGVGTDFQCGTKVQDIDRLSHALSGAGINHRKTDLLLEIKLY